MPHDYWPFLAAGLVGGTVNAAAGGAKLFVFPLLLATGLPPIVANASSTVALWPAQLPAAWVHRRELDGDARTFVLRAMPALVGALLGAVALVVLPERVFVAVVPALLIVSVGSLDADIPLVATDDPLEGAKGAVPFVGFDGTDMGKKVGEAATELLGESGWMDGDDYGVPSVEVQTLSVCNDRTNAARAALAAAGVPDTAFVSVSYEGTTDSALAAAGPVLTANPQVNRWVVYACNDEGVLGAANALKHAGFPAGDIIAVGLGASEACRPRKAGIESGFEAALYISGKDVGDAAARALIANVEDGTPLPPMTVANTTIVTPENYADIMPCG